jgi:hypothetical protein
MQQLQPEEAWLVDCEAPATPVPAAALIAGVVSTAVEPADDELLPA